MRSGMNALWHCLLPVIALAGFLTQAVAGTSTEDLAVRDLHADAQRSQREGLPILLMVEQAGCNYCALLDREVIQPMIASGDYLGKKVILRKLDIGQALPIRDFDGSSVVPADLARRYRATLTPTLLFLDHSGQELAPKMVGVSTLEFYWGYLDAAIDSARARLEPCTSEDTRTLAKGGAATGYC